MNTAVSRFVRIAIALGTVPLAAQAQESPVDDGSLPEIVVTAQKRAESLRDVPLSVEAVSGAKLEEAGIVKLEDLKAYVPNLQVSETGIANNIYIRGIGSGLNQGFEQSVSTYMDGIYRGRGHQSRMPFLDLERVEVLRGPQPILFGKNAVAGAVNMVGAKPTREFEGMFDASYDFENNDFIASAVLSGPLSERVGARLAVHGRTADGYVENLTLGRNEPARDEIAARLTMDFDVTDALSLSWRTEGGSYDTKGRQIEIFGETPITSGSLTGLTYSQIVAGPVPAFPQGQNLTARNNVLDYKRSSNGDSSDLANFETALTANYDFSNGLTLTSVTGYSNYSLDELCDCDFVGATVFDAGVTEHYDQFSQEFRLTSPADQTLSWIAGVYFQDYGLSEHDYLHVPTTSLVMPVLTSAFLQQGLCNSLATCSGLAGAFSDAVNPRDFKQDSTVYSAFAQATWRINDAWKLAFGGRFSKEDKNGSRVTSLTKGFGGPNLPPQVLPLFAAVLGIVPHNISGSRSENTFSPLVNLQYTFAHDSMVYLSWAQGSKAGGFDARSNKPPSLGGTFEFEDELATTYELGVKTAVGNTAEINADVFYTDYKDLQTSAFDGAIGFNVGNGSARVMGAEVQGRWRVTPSFTLSGSMAYLDFEWTNYFGQCYYGLAPIPAGQPNAGNCNYDGFTNQLAPKFTGYLSADYKWAVGSHLRMGVTADVIYSSKYLESLTLDPATTQDAYAKVNARLSLGDANGHWEVALVGRNLTDETTVSYAGDTPLANRLFRARSYYGFVDQPMGIALEARLNF
jgi:outer membrane receptor protein involved in Fe transport